MRKIRIVLILMLFIPSLLMAQEEQLKAVESVGSISTDRPVQSETPTVIPKKYLQFELGAYYEQGADYTCESRSSTDLISGPNLLMKYGLINNLEFRMTFDYLNLETTTKLAGEEIESTMAGVNAPVVGLKYAILKQEKGWKPNLAFSAHSQFDWWGSEDFQPEYNNVKLRMTCGKNLTENWYVIGGYETGITEGNTGSIDQFYVFQTGYTFFSSLTVLAELYGNRNYENGTNQNAINGALVYLINDNHQVDLSGGMGLEDNFYGYYTSIGYSFRLPSNCK